MLSYGAELSFFSIASSSINGFKSSIYDPNYILDRWFYFKNFLNFLSCKHIIFNDRLVESFVEPSIFSYLICTILSMGILLKIINIVKNKDYIHRTFYKIYNYKTKRFNTILIFTSIILLFISRYGYRYNYMIAILGLFMIFCIILSISNKYLNNNSFLAFSIINLSLFSTYMSVFSYMDLKCIRYILPAIPAFIYFIIYALNYIIHIINNGFTINNSLLETNANNASLKSEKLISKLIPICLIIICFLFIFNYTNTVEITEKGNDIINVCEFIINYDSDYQSKEIGCYMDRYYDGI